MSQDGFNRLIAVAQMKVDNANQNAMDGADKQRELVRKQQELHAAKSKFEQIVHKGATDQTDRATIQGLLDWMGEEGIMQDTSMPDIGQNNGDLKDAGNKGSKANNQGVDALRTRFEDADKDLQAQDKLGNFEIQGLMSDYNEAQTLASSIMKKKDDTGNAVIQKI
jgi:hypothetical protein